MKKKTLNNWVTVKRFSILIYFITCLVPVCLAQNGICLRLDRKLCKAGRAYAIFTDSTMQSFDHTTLSANIMNVQKLYSIIYKQRNRFYEIELGDSFNHYYLSDTLDFLYCRLKGKKKVYSFIYGYQEILLDFNSPLSQILIAHKVSRKRIRKLQSIILL
jgi:hypothetical protein